jgi:hypothetical protein
VRQRFGIDLRTVAKMLAFSVPPGYRRSRPTARPKLAHSAGSSIGSWRRTSDGRRNSSIPRSGSFERLRDEYGYGGGIKIVRAYVHEQRQRLREMFVPLRHDPGHAQVDFGDGSP